MPRKPKPDTYYDFVVGIDPGEKPGYCFVLHDPPLTVEIAPSAAQLLARMLGCVPQAVICEGQWIGPYNRSSTLHLARTAGAQMWGLFPEVPHYVLPPQVWRKAIGAGNSKQSAVDVIMRELGRDETYPSSVDELESVGIALAGLRLPLRLLRSYQEQPPT